jgi:FixJ family two-component response regulator
MSANARIKPLSVEQEHAIDGLVTGKTDRETAEAVGVSRRTVQPWRTQHRSYGHA